VQLLSRITLCSIYGTTHIYLTFSKSHLLYPDVHQLPDHSTSLILCENKSRTESSDIKITQFYNLRHEKLKKVSPVHYNSIEFLRVNMTNRLWIFGWSGVLHLCLELWLSVLLLSTFHGGRHKLQRNKKRENSKLRITGKVLELTRV